MRVLDAQYSASGLTLPESGRSLKHPDCRVVTVGHQLVLAGGPAFFHHKILTAIRVARGLSKASGQPVVPVFWMASEDHDWKEIATVHGATRAHDWAPAHPEVPHPVGALDWRASKKCSTRGWRMGLTLRRQRTCRRMSRRL